VPVPSLASLLQQIPDEFKPLAALGVGALILVLLVIFHGISLHKILVHFKRRELRLESGRPHLWGAAFLFGWAIFMMLVLHIAEIAAWAFALLHLGLAVNPANALYFSANAYTTMGYGAVDLDVHWRNITPIIAISGLFTFAWTTSLLVTMVSSYMKIVEQLEVERSKQFKMRADSRHSEWEVIDKERQAEKNERAATRKAAAGAGFFDRRKMWHEEKEREGQLREAAHTEVERLRAAESAAEDKLGENFPIDDPGVDK
jgi:Ion channel